ncbi:HAD-IB family phosphatase [Stigmatella aurantiaca]|uniref:2,3-diketo-5-methylthio-1-phosphopentane phosphatase n=1 Tax=Stigmatella aurantiaca (strain DW4/3-1) TaxID=378806 RepID=Q08SD5_STIAD|nr:HAD-IB family phosphatase [Stigmatella aurantiaca]ADO70704.1 2,3-diketo-5-methylthio-1-phosphopentane phosphatase [Stigmatella aurantiaca DW4/3-1]EAU63385.1 phosphoserine phosphatase, putative [Stigmatella aurantiaca DW4/3-1]
MAWDIFCDFDGTMVLGDVMDTLLERFAPPAWREIEQEWKLGHIGSRERLAQQVSLLDMSRAELDQQLDRIMLDPGFPAFFQDAWAAGHRITLLSEGFDYAIHRILSRHALTDIPFRANVLQQRSERGWQLMFPQSRWDTASSRPCLLIGNGSWDFCAAQTVDLVFAKRKTLMDHCAQRGLPFQAIQGFADARRLLPSLSQRPSAAPLLRPTRRDSKKCMGA